MTGPSSDHLAGIARAVRGGRVTILTGAGVSAESGIPTFREAQTGLWARFLPEELASPEAFERAPDRVWNWYAWRRSLVAAATPNAAHLSIAGLADCAARLTLVTQNVDGFHQQAGSRDVIELHGNINRTRCSRENRIVEEWSDDGSVPPHCPHCGGWLRPDVVWFGEMLPGRELERAQRAALECDVFLSIGTSGLVYPAAALPSIAHAAGARIVVINPDDDTPLLGLPGVVHLRESAASVVPELLALAAGAVQ